MSGENKIVNACPICDSNEFRPYNDGEFTFRHVKKSYVVPNQEYACCANCGTRGFLPGQRAKNLQTIKNFQASIPEYISPSDVLSVRERYNLTQKQASQLFKGGVNGFSKWERGAAFPTASTAMLLKVALASPEAMQKLVEVARVDFEVVDQLDEPKKPAKALPLQSSVIIQCTHAEYREDTAFNDETEADQEWKNLNQPVISTASSFLN